MDPQQVYQAPGSKHHFVNNVELNVFYIIVTLSLPQAQLRNFSNKKLHIDFLHRFTSRIHTAKHNPICTVLRRSCCLAVKHHKFSAQ